jgi:hypothetical protein
MKRITLSTLVACLCLVSMATAQQRPRAPIREKQANKTREPWTSSARLPWGSCPSSQWLVRNIEREVLTGDVVHYSFEVRIGSGEFEVIRLHRVVREPHPHRPMRTDDPVMLFPGAPTLFEGLYIEPSISAISPDRSIAVFLAKHGIDVWGMDYAWALVPTETTDFGFMKGWGVDKDVAHAQAALALARLIRGSKDRFYLAGLSYGGLMSYAVAADDSQRPRVLRNVKGIIPMDMAVKLDDPDARAASCDALAADQDRIENQGIYYDDSGVYLKMFGELALSAPDEPSPFDPSFTNYVYALLVGASPLPPVAWHFVGSYLDANGIPYDLRYTEPRLWLDLLNAGVPPYSPWQSNLDLDAAWCDGAVDVPFDDHVPDIAVPILYVGAAGGYGDFGLYTTTLTRSTDVTTLVVRLLPDDERAMDFGHGDLVAAQDAETLVWQPILDWLTAHR